MLLRRWLSALAVTLLLAGCALSREQSKTARTATEQLLLSQAVEHSLDHVSVPLPHGAPVFVKAVGLAADQAIVRDMVADQLGAQGMRVREKEEEATYLVRVIVQALGTEQLRTFFGMPPIQSVVIPFSLPELALYKVEQQVAVSRFYLEVFERTTGRYIISTRWYEGAAHYKQYTMLFLIGFHSTDLTPPL